MCHDDDSRPPAPPVHGEAAARSDLRLTAGDGNQLLAHSARAAAPTGSGVVVMPDVRGLHAYYRELAARFAEAGMDAVAIDYFGRTANTDDRTEAFDFMSHVQQATEPGVAADVAAGASYLRTDDGGSVERVFTVGFCFGGGLSWLQSADTSRACRMHRLLWPSGARARAHRSADRAAAHADGWRGPEHSTRRSRGIRRAGT